MENNIKINGEVIIELEERDVIHCDTKEKAKELLKALYNAGYEWNGGTDLLYDNKYDNYGEETCYCIEGQKKVTFSDISFFKSDVNRYNLIEYDSLFVVNADELWEAVRAVTCSVEHGGLAYDECLEIFDGMSYSKAIMAYSPKYFLKKYKEWKEKQVVCGDILKNKQTGSEYMIFRVEKHNLSVIDKEGKYYNINKMTLNEYEKVRNKTIKNLFS